MLGVFADLASSRKAAIKRHYVNDDHLLSWSRSPARQAKRCYVINACSIEMCICCLCRPQPWTLHIFAILLWYTRPRPVPVRCTGPAPAGTRGHCGRRRRLTLVRSVGESTTFDAERDICFTDCELVTENEYDKVREYWILNRPDLHLTKATLSIFPVRPIYGRHKGSQKNRNRNYDVCR